MLRMYACADGCSDWRADTFKSTNNIEGSLQEASQLDELVKLLAIYRRQLIGRE